MVASEDVSKRERMIEVYRVKKSCSGWIEMVLVIFFSHIALMLLVKDRDRKVYKDDESRRGKKGNKRKNTLYA